MVKIIIGRLGIDAVAANFIAIGNELGAGHLEQAKKEGAYLCKLSIISKIVTGVFLLAISPLILSFASIKSINGSKT